MGALRCEFVGQWYWFVEKAGLGGLLIVCLKNWLWRVVAGEMAVRVGWRIECLCAVGCGSGFGDLDGFGEFGERLGEFGSG